MKDSSHFDENTQVCVFDNILCFAFLNEIVKKIEGMIHVFLEIINFHRSQTLAIYQIEMNC